MTINLTELRDEPLGKHPIQAAVCYVVICKSCTTEAPEQDVVAADDESSFTFDVDGLSDEALDPPTRSVLLVCSHIASTCVLEYASMPQGRLA